MLDTLTPRTHQKMSRLIARFAHPPADLELMVESDRLDAMGFDSLSRIELGMALEDEFDIAMPDDMMRSVQTVGDVLKLVAGQLA